MRYFLFLFLAVVALLGRFTRGTEYLLVSDALLDGWCRLFLFLFVFRYLRTIVNVVAYMRSKAIPVPEFPSFTAKDVTVIIPTVEPCGPIFRECLRTVLSNAPAEILIATVGYENIRQANEICEELGSYIKVLSVPQPNKREQVKRAIYEAQTSLIVLCDDTVFWPRSFLQHAVAPFEDPLVGIVGTCKRVRRVFGSFGLTDFWNLCGVMRLERTNFDLAATNAVDGGLSCVSGRTCAVRSAILKDPDFLHAYTNEYIFWGSLGPLNAGDDKFVTRWIMTKGWKVRHQNCDEARIETILGIKGGSTRFLAQCLRWARSSARDNPKMIFNDGLWRRYPWTTYAVLATSIVNFAAIYDPVLVFVLYKALKNPSLSKPAGGSAFPLILLLLWILATKFVRPAPHYWRNPSDLRYAPFIILFGYYHSWIKLCALVTCWDISWGTRAGVDAAPKVAKLPHHSCRLT